jgi:enamine deaminase RidA (YjgF/YER057c/UK114 family)
MKRENISSNTVWENKVGYSRAVKVGNTIEVAGTTATDGDEVIGKGSMYEQTKFIFLKVERALLEVNASLKDVVRTRMFVTDISKWEEAAKAHHEYFKEIRPAATMIEVSKLINPEHLIEVEVTEIIT